MPNVSSNLVAGLSPHIVFTDDRIFKGLVVKVVLFFVGLFGLMLWAVLACAYRAKKFSAIFLE